MIEVLTKISRVVFVLLMVGGALFASSPSQARGAPQFSVSRNTNNRGRDARLIARAESVTGDSFKVFLTTPRGAHIYARTAPRPETLQAIDSGLTELFAIARKHNYRARLQYSDYTIFIARPDRSRDRDGNYSPDIAVSAGQYRGSVYDYGGYVYAAGMVVAFQPCAFVIAEHERDWQRVSNVARYEGEHLVLYHNDRRRFTQTQDHSQGGSHPILQ